MIGTNGLALAPGCRIICVSSRPSKIGIAQSVMHDVGHVMGEGVEAGRAVLGLIDLARAEAMQQRADDAPHVGVVVDDEEAQAIEIDANHDAPKGRAMPGPQRYEGKMGAVKERFRIEPERAVARARRRRCAHRQKWARFKALAAFASPAST